MDAAAVGGGQVIVVDADNELLIPFCESCGFIHTGLAGSVRLFMKVSTAKKALGQK